MFCFTSIQSLQRIVTFHSRISHSNKNEFSSNKIRKTFQLTASNSYIPPSFELVPILSSIDDGTSLKLIDVKVPLHIAEAYTNPGQYVQIKIGDTKPGFYAIASPPDGRDVLTFLVKETDTNLWLTKASVGSSIEITKPQGKGFQIEEYFNSYRYDYPTTNIYLMATGSGLAPIAAAIESQALGLGVTPKNAITKRNAILYLGARSEDRIPLQHKFSEWKNKYNLEIIPVLSLPKENSNWTGKKGYIQDSLRSDEVKLPRNSGALLCGQRGMIDAVKDILLTTGVFEGKILLNF